MDKIKSITLVGVDAKKFKEFLDNLDEPTREELKETMEEAMKQLASYNKITECEEDKNV